MRVLFLENHDSFSWNVIDALPVQRDDVSIISGNPPQAMGHPINVAVSSATLQGFDCLVIGPGPTDPIRAGIVDIVRQAAEIRLPTFGVCLGHQAIGLAFGARLIRTLPMHGKQSSVEFAPSRLFPGISGCHTVMRYHSLSLDEVESPLKVIARTSEGIPMAIEHESLPIAGVQFHPDSYATETGRAMIAAFFGAIA
jgi:anthranilate synthase/aminodeoxychorismate synthase-like glutamine amidotransferase